MADLAPEERALDRLLRQRPELASKIAGQLDGPPSEQRPDVAPWNYLSYARARPEASVSELAEVRFALIMGGRLVTITSLTSDMRDLSYDATTVTLDDVVWRYQILADAGAIAWMSESRAVDIRIPFDELAPLYRRWRTELNTRRQDRT